MRIRVKAQQQRKSNWRWRFSGSGIGIGDGAGGGGNDDRHGSCVALMESNDYALDRKSDGDWLLLYASTNTRAKDDAISIIILSKLFLEAQDRDGSETRTEMWGGGGGVGIRKSIQPDEEDCQVRGSSVYMKREKRERERAKRMADWRRRCTSSNVGVPMSPNEKRAKRKSFRLQQQQLQRPASRLAAPQQWNKVKEETREKGAKIRRRRDDDGKPQ